MRKSAPLAFGQVSILHAIAAGNRFGFDIMDATGPTSRTAHPAPRQPQYPRYPPPHTREPRGSPAAQGEAGGAARRNKPPPRRYFDLTSAGATALADAL